MIIPIKLLLILLCVIIATPVVRQLGGGAQKCLLCGNGTECPPEKCNDINNHLEKDVTLSMNRKGKRCHFQWSGYKGGLVGLGRKEHAGKFDCRAKRGDPIRIKRSGKKYYITDKRGCGLEISGTAGRNYGVARHENVAKFDCARRQADPMVITGTPDDVRIYSTFRGKKCGLTWSRVPGYRRLKGFAKDEYLGKFNCKNAEGDSFKLHA